MKQILATAALGLLLAGCGGASDEAATSADATPADGTASAVASAAASAAAAGAGLDVSTSDLPDFVALPPGAKAIQRMNVNQNGQVGGMLVLETAQSPAEVLAFYRERMAKAGLKVAMETTTADGAMIAGATEGEGKVLTVTVNPADNGKTSVAITHAMKEG